MTNTVYKDILLDHYRHPRNQGSLDGAHHFSKGFNANCGDKIKLGVFLEGNRLQQVKFQARACAICTASTSMMTEQMIGRTTEQARQIIHQIEAAVIGKADWPAGCEALAGAAGSVNRHKCITLSWQALAESLPNNHEQR